MLKLKHLTTAFMTLALVVLLIPGQASATTDYTWAKPRAGWCIDFDLKVAPSPTQARDWKVEAVYCQPWRWASGRHSVDVLTHGATYTHTYWNWPQEGYSYVNQTLNSGRATLSYDRIGNGDSTRPLSTDITMATDAYVLHQLVSLMRLFGFRAVNSISHSYGSGVALQEAATYGDVNSVVVSGYLHRPSNPAVTAGNYPANQDPKFVDLGLDNGWLTSRPGVRGTSFHSPTSDPDLVAVDENQKDLVSLTGLLSFIAARGVPAGDNVSRQVRVPVLVLLGEQDAIFCYQPAVFDCSDRALVTANEAPFYQDLTVVTVPESGHDLALHPSNGSSYRAIDRFLERVQN